MGVGESLTLLSRERVRDLAALAQQARSDLSRFSGREVGSSADILQILDEWIDDYLEERPSPPPPVRLLWTSLLGEIFRRRHEGWWALQDGKLVTVCRTEGGDWHLVRVRDQIDRRIKAGMAESLTYFYNTTRIELRMR
jgi:hypothetical protein